MKRTIFTIITAACLGFSAIAQEQAPASTTTSTTASTTVGSIPGTSGVSPTGAATYTIPIEVPAGVNGIQPEITINYNSQGGSGALGIGWDMGGLSTITRGSKNIYFDGKIESTHFDNSDALYLDGQRLLLLFGNNLESGAIYGKEIEDFTRITIKTNTQGAIYFELKTKEGGTVEYGNTSDARITNAQPNIDTKYNTKWDYRPDPNNIHNSIPIASVAVREYMGNPEDDSRVSGWRINKASNLLGAAVNYVYTDHGARVQQINYNNSTVSLNFSYSQQNSAVRKANNRGFLSVNNYLLSSISINSGNVNELFTYQFSYSTTSNAFLRLTDIKKVASDKSAMNDTHVEWGANNEQLTTQYLDSKGALKTFFADVNGDGQIDKICYETYDIETKTKNPDFNVIIGYNHSQPIYKECCCTGIRNSMGPCPEFLINIQKHSKYIIYIGSGFDVNGVATFNQTGILLHQDPIEKYMESTITTGDINNDGKDEIILLTGTNNGEQLIVYQYINGNITQLGLAREIENIVEPITNYLNHGDSDKPIKRVAQLMIANNNNDQYGDIILVLGGLESPRFWLDPEGLYNISSTAYIANGNASGLDPVCAAMYGASTPDFTVGDYNADGVIDVITRYAMAGFGGACPSPNIRYCGNFGYKYIDDYRSILKIPIYADFDSDGLTDYLSSSISGDFHLTMNLGPYSAFHKDITIDGLSAYNQYNSSAFDNDQPSSAEKGDVYVLDYNGDGMLDIVVADEIYGGHGLAEPSFHQTDWKFVKNLNNYHFLGNNDQTVPDGSKHFELNQTFTVNSKLTFENKKAVVADLNGDGVSDLYDPSTNTIYTMKNTKNQHLVTSITNGMGLTTSFSYKNFTDYEQTPSSGDFRNLKSPIIIVDGVIEQDGSTSSYEFKKPITHIKGKGFLGFTNMTVTNSLQNRKTETVSSYSTDNNGYVYQNSVTNTVTTIDNKAISSSQQTYSVKVPTIPSANSSVMRRIVTNGMQSNTNSLTGISQSVANSFDVYGNLTTTIATGGDITNTTNTTFISRVSGEVPYLAEKVTTERAQSGSKITRIKDFKYNSHGMIIQEIDDQSDKNQLTTTYTDFDTWGMPQTTTVTGRENGVDVSRVSHNYRTASGRFIKSETNAIGQYTSYNWDETTGLLLDKTEYLNKKTLYTYDVWGRLTSTKNEQNGVLSSSTINVETPPSFWLNKTVVIVPNLIYFTIPTYDFVARDNYYSKFKSGNTPYYSVLTTTTDQNSKTVATPVTVWYDIFGREMKRMTYGLDATSPIYQFTEYTADGKVYRASAPTYSTTAQSWDKTYIYDEYGRILTINTPAGKESYSYYNKTSSVKGIDGMNTKSEINDAGQTISVERFYTAALTPRKKVNYTYYPSGLVHTITPDGGTTITMEYDLQGRRTKLTDPDAGETTTEYSAFGDITSESRKKGTKTITTRYYYLANGLLDKKQINNDLMQIYQYSYDSNIKGRLNQENKLAQHSKKYIYDDANGNNDRIISVVQTVGVKKYTTSYTYDQYGRQLTVTFPTGYTTTNHYDGFGNMTQITDNKNRNIWQAKEENVRGQLTKVGKLQTEETFVYDNAGRTTEIKCSDIINMHYVYYADGNLKQRVDNNTKNDETFTYDEFNRLTTWTVAGFAVNPITHSITYDDITGNISNKSDVGSFNLKYTNTAKPHQLTGMDGVPAGMPSNDLNITYTDFDKVSKIQQNPKGAYDKYKTYDITYGVDDKRITSTYSINFTTQLKTTYLGNFEEEYDAVNKTYKKTHYLQGAIYIQTVKADGTTSEQFYSTISDFQGSLIALIDEQGAVAERYAFDPWGARRNPDDWTQTDARTSWITHRGYTGHEHIDVFGVINMNGRVYDPMTAIFFSPDPFVQSAGDWMHYNRYAYCLNNPFRFTDPSGNIPILVGLLIGAAISAVVYTASVALSPGGLDNWNFSHCMTATLQGAIAGACTAGIGNLFGSVGGVGGELAKAGINLGSVGNELARAAVHGLSNGLIGMAFEGDFEHAFVAGALGSLGGSVFQAYGGEAAKSFIGTVAFSSLSGGLGSALSGGDFWKGAAIGAMVGALNHGEKLLEQVSQKSSSNQIIYQRTTETNESTTGTFSIPGTKISGYILEPAGPSTTESGLDRRIPAGTYNLKKNVGSKYGLRLYNNVVPQSRAILMHIGNYPKDTEGCLLPGSSIGHDLVGGSGPVIQQIMNHFNRIGFNGAIITILDINK